MKMKEPKEVRMPSDHAQSLVENYIESSGSDREVFAYIRQLEDDVAAWKTRAAQHGCNVDGSDDDCG